MVAPSPANETNPYAPPVAEVRDIPATETPEFYVVSARKYFLLFLLTFGLYIHYWFYRHWSHLKRHRGLNLWPIPRGIFAIFFTHALAREIDARLETQSPRYRWSPSRVATLLVMLMIVYSVLDRMVWRDIGVPLTAWLSFLIPLPMAFLGHIMQRAANAACGDPEGNGNATITAANMVWMILGAIVLVLGLLGLMLPDTWE